MKNDDIDGEGEEAQGTMGSLVKDTLARLAITAKALSNELDNKPKAQRQSVVQKELQLVEVVRGMIRHAATENGARNVADLVKNGHVEECRSLCDQWSSALRVVKAQGRTPSATSTPVAGATKRDKDVVNKCGERDNFRCVITKAGYSDLARKVLVDAAPKPLKSQGEEMFESWLTTLKADGCRYDACSVAHFIPFSIQKQQGSLRFFETISGLSLHEFYGKKVDTVINTTVLSESMHRLQGRFDLVFRATEADGVYRVEITPQAARGFFPGDFPKIVTYDLSSLIPPPSPKIIQLLSSLFDIMHASAAAEAILLQPMLDDEWDFGVSADRDVTSELGVQILDGALTSLET